MMTNQGEPIVTNNNRVDERWLTGDELRNKAIIQKKGSNKHHRQTVNEGRPAGDKLLTQSNYPQNGERPAGDKIA